MTRAQCFSTLVVLLLLSEFSYANVCDDKTTQQRYALLIGISEYPTALDSSVAYAPLPLNGAVNDITLMKRICTNHSRSPSEKLTQ